MMRQKQEDSEKVEVDAAPHKTNQIFSSKFGMLWRSKVSVFNERKVCNTIFVKPDFKSFVKTYFVNFGYFPIICLSAIV
jgi:hypothetical protein